MPRIPMSERGFVPHVENNVRMHGAPGMDFGMADIRAFRDAGNALQNGLDDFGRGALARGGAMRDFVEREAETQNRLAATNARNLYRAYDEELENRMAENPTEFKDFSKWADETDKKYLADVRQYTEQMTTPFRQQFEAEMEGIRIDSLSRRRKIGIQAKVTADYNMAKTLLKDAAERGDSDGYMRILEENKGILFSEEEYNMRKVEYDRLAESSAAKRLVDMAGESANLVQMQSALDQLKERDSDGNFVNFKHLPDDYRDQLIRASEAQRNKAELEDDQQFLAGLYQGQIPTEEMLVHAQKDGLITEEQFNKRMGWVKQFMSNASTEAKRAEAEAKQAKKDEEAQDAAWFEASMHMGAPKYKDQNELDTAFKAGELNVDQYNKYSNALASYNANIERAKEQAAEKAKKNLVNAFKWEIYRKKIPLKLEDAYAEAKKIWGDIQKTVKDPETLLDLSKFLDKKVSDTLSQKEDEFQTPDGQHVLKFIENTYWTEEGYRGLVYDEGWFWDGDNSQDHQRAQFYNILEMARERLRAGQPAEKIEEFITEKVGQMNKGKIRTVLEMMHSPQPNDRVMKSVLRIGTRPGAL